MTTPGLLFLIRLACEIGRANTRELWVSVAPSHFSTTYSQRSYGFNVGSSKSEAAWYAQRLRISLRLSQARKATQPTSAHLRAGSCRKS